jgi:nucleoside-diphosphate-sugar epimerase
MPHDCQSPYAISKLTNELFAKFFYETHGLQTVCLRYFNVYGRRQNPFSDYAAVIPRFIRFALNNEPVTIYGDGLQTRDFIYIDDIVECNRLALTVKTTEPLTLNAASGRSVSIVELADIILKRANSNAKLTFLPPMPGDVRNSAADPSMAKKSLGFQARFTLEQGLDKTIEWYRDKV